MRVKNQNNWYNYFGDNKNYIVKGEYIYISWPRKSTSTWLLGTLIWTQGDTPALLVIAEKWKLSNCSAVC